MARRGDRSRIYTPERKIFRFEPHSGAAPGGGFRAHLRRADWRSPMLDLGLIALGFAFLGVAVLYVYACDHL
jgi:hypothetical protein